MHIAIIAERFPTTVLALQLRLAENVFDPQSHNLLLRWTPRQMPGHWENRCTNLRRGFEEGRLEAKNGQFRSSRVRKLLNTWAWTWEAWKYALWHAAHHVILREGALHKMCFMEHRSQDARRDRYAVSHFSGGAKEAVRASCRKTLGLARNFSV